MGDSFFDGTLDDFFDHGFLELASLALPLSPSPLRSLRASPVRTVPVETRVFPQPGRGDLTSIETDHASLFDGGGRSIFPHRQSGSGLGAGLGPTLAAERAEASYRPSLDSFRPYASRRALVERANPARFQPTSPLLNAASQSATASATLNSSRGAFPASFAFQLLPDPPASAAPRYRSRGENPDSERFSQDPLRRSIQPRSPPQESGIPAVADPSRRSVRQRVTPYDSDDSAPSLTPSVRSSPSPIATMSSNARSRRNLRAGDLAMPSAPSRAGPSSVPPPSAFSNRAASRSQLEVVSSYRPSFGAALSSDPVIVAVNKRKREADDDLFGDNGVEDPEVVDLVDKDEIPADVLNNNQQEKEKNWVKLGALDCVICMDNATDLTVTHCGHLFCSECLHSALNMDPSRRICPICRRKIDKLPGCGKFGRGGKGFYPLELKLMTKEALNADREQS